MTLTLSVEFNSIALLTKASAEPFTFPFFFLYSSTKEYTSLGFITSHNPSQARTRKSSSEREYFVISGSAVTNLLNLLLIIIIIIDYYYYY